MKNFAGPSPTGLTRDALSKKTDRALSALETRTCHSWKMALDRAQILPKTADAISEPINLYIRAASGARMTDIDGNVFIDLNLGCGAQILGHNHPVVRDAVVAQAARSWNFGLPGADQLELARLIQTASPANERVVLCNASADATVFAIDAARAFKRRNKIAIFPRAASVSLAVAQGETAEWPTSTLTTEHSVALPYGEAIALERIRDLRDELAAVVVEPIRAAAPSLDHANWLRELATVCGECGILLVFDETFTGFRLAYGGAQELLGVMPDLTCYGRVVGGGLPLGAVGGRADIIEAAAQTPARIDVHGRRFLGNPLSIAAGVATLGELLAGRATLYPKLNEAGMALAQEFNAFCTSERLPVTMQAVGSMFRIQFGTAAPSFAAATIPQAESAFYLFALSRSVFFAASRLGFLSVAHRRAELDYVVSALTESLHDVRADGLFTPVLC